MPRFALIDLGSNTIRLCVYEVERERYSTLERRDIHTLLNYKTMAGLASFIKEGAITKKGIKKAVNTIQAHIKRAQHFMCDTIEIFATAVLRNCTNSLEAKTMIEQACGISITILTNEEEAHLGFVGAKLDQNITEGVVIDIGGGSTELTLVEKSRDIQDVSIPQGSLSSFSLYVETIMPTAQEISAIAKSIRSLLQESQFDLSSATNLYGIGGALRSAAKVYGDVCNEGQRSIVLSAQQIDQLLSCYLRDPAHFTHQALQTIPDRIHTFIPGCIIAREIFDTARANKLTICKSGIREGYLAERILSKA